MAIKDPDEKGLRALNKLSRAELSDELMVVCGCREWADAVKTLTLVLSDISFSALLYTTHNTDLRILLMCTYPPPFPFS